MDGPLNQDAPTQGLFELARAIHMLATPMGAERLIDAVLALRRWHDADPLLARLLAEGGVTLSPPVDEQIRLSEDEHEARIEDERPTVRVNGVTRAGVRRLVVPRALVPGRELVVLEPHLPGISRWAVEEVPARWAPDLRVGELSWLRRAVVSAGPTLLRPEEGGRPNPRSDALLTLLQRAGCEARLTVDAPSARALELESWAEWRRRGPDALVEHGLVVDGQRWREAEKIRYQPPLIPLRELDSILEQILSCTLAFEADPSGALLQFRAALARPGDRDTAERVALWEQAPMVIAEAIDLLDGAVAPNAKLGDAQVAVLDDLIGDLQRWWSASMGQPPFAARFGHPGTYRLATLAELSSQGAIELRMYHTPEDERSVRIHAVAVIAERGRRIVYGFARDTPAALAALRAILGDAKLVGELTEEVRARMLQLLRQPSVGAPFEEVVWQCAASLAARFRRRVADQDIGGADGLLDQMRLHNLVRDATRQEQNLTHPRIATPLSVARGRPALILAGQDTCLVAPQVLIAHLPVLEPGCGDSRDPGPDPSAALNEPSDLDRAAEHALRRSLERLQVAREPKEMADSGADALAWIWLRRVLRLAGARAPARGEGPAGSPTEAPPRGERTDDPLERALCQALRWNGAAVLPEAGSGRTARDTIRPLLSSPPLWFGVLLRLALQTAEAEGKALPSAPPRVIWTPAEQDLQDQDDLGGGLSFARNLPPPPHGTAEEIVARLLSPDADSLLQRVTEAERALRPILPQLGLLLAPARVGEHGSFVREKLRGEPPWVMRAFPNAPLNVSWAPGLRRTVPHEAWVTPPTVALSGVPERFLSQRFPCAGDDLPIPIVCFGLPRRKEAISSLLDSGTMLSDDDVARFVAAAVFVSPWWPPQISASVQTRVELAQLLSSTTDPCRYPLDRQSFELLRFTMSRWNEGPRSERVGVQVESDRIHIAIRTYTIDRNRPGKAGFGLVEVTPR